MQQALGGAGLIGCVQSAQHSEHVAWVSIAVFPFNYQANFNQPSKKSQKEMQITCIAITSKTSRLGEK